MNVETTGSIGTSYSPGMNTFGSAALQRQIQLLQLQMTQIEQGTLDQSAKEDQIAALESRVENLQSRLQILQSQEASASSSTESTASVLSEFASRRSDSGQGVSNVLYQPFGNTTSINSSVARLIAYA